MGNILYQTNSMLSIDNIFPFLDVYKRQAVSCLSSLSPCSNQTIYSYFNLFAAGIQLKALAKINLGLDVLRRREDGYHEVKMIMQTISPVSYTHLTAFFISVKMWTGCRRCWKEAFLLMRPFF